MMLIVDSKNRGFRRCPNLNVARNHLLLDDDYKDDGDTMIASREIAEGIKLRTYLLPGKQSGPNVLCCSGE